MTSLSIVRHVAIAGLAALAIGVFGAGASGASEVHSPAGAASSWNVTKLKAGHVKRRKRVRRHVRPGYHWHSNADFREVTTPVSHYAHRRFRGFGASGDGYRTSGKYN